jgi:hypothetical protein
MQNLFKPSLVTLAIAAILASSTLCAEESITQDNYISGTLVVDWNSRLPQNQDADHPKLGVSDLYHMDATVGLTFYKGQISCLPYVFSRHIGRVLQEGSCHYDLDLGVINPKNTSQKRVVGKLVGQRPLDREGRTDLSASNLRVEVQTIGQAKGFSSTFAGLIQGRPVKAETTLNKLIAQAKRKTATITRMMGGKQVSLTLANVDPVTFQGVKVAAGPSSNYPEARINGQFIYSYETDNWFPAFTLAYGDSQDKVSGGMKWVDDGDTSGHYELNILLNEEQAPQGEAAAFAAPQGEDAFFMADPGKSTLKGTISFVDTHVTGVGEPVKSDIKYAIGLQQLTAQQAQVLWKTLLLIPSQLYGE